uniref:Uncharacterized protein n=1 Tax=Lygus hesperus TaxID=30085 RepID=A0A0K8SC76_LYGHE
MRIKEFRRRIEGSYQGGGRRDQGLSPLGLWTRIANGIATCCERKLNLSVEGKTNNRSSMADVVEWLRYKESFKFLQTPAKYHNFLTISRPQHCQFERMHYLLPE